VTGHVEREVKLDADPDLELPDLNGVVTGIHAVPRPTLDLDATYFDAVDTRLLAAGVTVRRRSGEGTRWTVKLPASPPISGRRSVGPGGSARPAAVSRREVDVFDQGLAVPSQVVDLVADWLGDGALVPVARLLSHRRRVGLGLDPSGRQWLAELDDDLVSVEVDERPVGRFREIEVEQTDVDDAAGGPLVRAVVDRLVAAGARPGSSSSKLARALALVAGQ
jgi:CYTH domain